MSKPSAVILVNLGTPEAPTKKAVGKFLKAFLSDKRVIEAPAWFWQPLLRCVILPIRSGKSAHAYQQIWWPEGSPLKVISERQVDRLQAVLKERMGDNAPKVAGACTYGSPSLADQVQQLAEKGIEHFVVIPMYPQYSATTTGAVLDQISLLMLSMRNVPEITPVKDFHQRPGYIGALARSIREYWQQYGRNQKLLMSFHGIPKEYADKGDPYPRQCQTTAELVAKALNLQEGDWAFSYQSRFGPKQWVLPYTEQTLKEWGENGIESVDVVSPAFAADCLETLEELNIANRDLFLQAGGKNYSYIPCLNDDMPFINVLADLVEDRLY